MTLPASRLPSLESAITTITAVYSGDAAFSGSTGAVTQVVNPAITTTSLTSDINPSRYGVQVTFTATVSPATAGGTVEFFDGATSLGTSPLAGGVATFLTASLSVGSHSITGVYSGDATFAPSTSGAVAQVVDRGTTATALGSSVNPSVEGGSVTFTATVSPVTGVGLQSGTVQFFDGAVSLGSPALSGGQASVTLTLAAGVHSITAVYSGDGNFTGSTSPAFAQNVLRRTTTVVTSNRVPTANFGQNITFTATVRPVTGTGFPTAGTVEFRENGTLLGTGTYIGNGRWTFQTNTLAAGSHTITAVFLAAGTFAASSGSYVQVVNQAATTTTVTSSVNPSVFGRSITLTARVQPNPGAGTNVEFFEGSTSLGSFPLDATGRARLAISTLSVGTHGINAIYPGTANYLTSTSAVFNQTVTKANSRTVVTTSGSPANFGQPVTFTATVSAVAPGAGVPTGTVQFRIDGVNVVGGPTSLAGGQAQYTTSALSVGLHRISAVYNGDINFNASTSANRNQRII